MSDNLGIRVPSDEQWDLIELSLQNGADACQSGHAVLGKPGLDPVAEKYLRALRAVENLRRDLG
jgi:hypothetical protein